MNAHTVIPDLFDNIWEGGSKPAHISALILILSSSDDGVTWCFLRAANTIIQRAFL
jgi:hypothetical protein